MDSEQTFWYSISKLITVVTCVLILAVTGNRANHKYQLRALITEAKMDPIAASCAFDAGDANHTQCIIHNARKQ